MTILLILFGKAVAFVSKLLNKGNGSTWPGHIALALDRNFIRKIQKKSQIQIVIIVGTNGKTTTSKIVATILENSGKKVLQNTSGANLLNGIASTLLLHANLIGKVNADFAIFEIDENTLPLILKEITPFAIIALNLFRDQLDRYGELDSIAKKWKESFMSLSKETLFILNADDPQIAYLGDNIHAKTIFFGLEEKGIRKLQHAADSIYCPQCSTKLTFDRIYYSHLGIWHCANCHFTRPKPTLTSFFYPLDGTYNKYNTLAAVVFAQEIGIKEKEIESALQKITPAFGRQEKIIVHGKTVQIFLAKNPTSFNQSLQTIANRKAKYILIILNDRIPDGRDVSWIWDIDFEDYVERFDNIIVSGDRVYDMALRVNYSKNFQFPISNFKKNNKLRIFEDLEEAIQKGLESINKDETLYILPTYSAMLEVRKILTGRKIL